MAGAGDSQSNVIEMWPLERLRPHPENAKIFDDPEESVETFATLLLSIKKSGIWEPLLVKADGTILAGHMRHACAARLGLAEVPVRVWNVATYIEEVTMLIRSNTDRRQLTKGEIGLAFKRLREIPREQGGAMAVRGRPRKEEENKGAKSGTFSKTRDEAAERLGVQRGVAEACETVFTVPGVPDEVKKAVNDGRLAPTTTAQAIRDEVKVQGGTLTSGEPLLDLLTARRHRDNRPDHEKRLEAQVDKYNEGHERLLKLYRELDSVLLALPLATLLGPTEHQEYRGTLQCIVQRALLELQPSKDGPKKPTLTAIKGGKQ